MIVKPDAWLTPKYDNNGIWDGKSYLLKSKSEFSGKSFPIRFLAAGVRTIAHEQLRLPLSVAPVHGQLPLPLGA